MKKKSIETGEPARSDLSSYRATLRRMKRFLALVGAVSVTVTVSPAAPGLAAMVEVVEALCGPRYRPDSQSVYHRAGSKTGVAYLNVELLTVTVYRKSAIAIAQKLAC